MSVLRVRELRRLSDVSALEWAALRARPPASLSGSPAWAEAAFAAQHPAAAPLLLAVEHRDRLVALLPLAVHYAPGSRPTVRFAGAPRNDLTDLLALPGYEREAAELVIETLCSLPGRGRRVELDAVDPDGVLAGADPRRCALRWTPGDIAPVVDLRGPWRSAPSLRRRRRWDAALDAVWTRRAVRFRRLDGAGVAAELTPFLRMREARLAAAGRAIDRLRDRSIQEMLAALAARGCVAIMQMLIDGAVAAADLYLLDRPVAMARLRALDPEWRHVPCGHLLMRASAEAFAAEGYEVLDLGRGAEPYKFGFGATPRVLLRACLGTDLPDLES
jgi:CelD/BcsL family acetyltransferase involved in cellulose biosynthesis